MDNAQNTVHREGLVGGGHLELSHAFPSQVHGQKRPGQEEVWTEELQDEVRSVLLLCCYHGNEPKVLCIDQQ